VTDGPPEGSAILGSPDSLLREGARRLGISLQKKQVDQFLAYLNELKQWNRRINLTALTTNKEIIERHFLDSLMGVRAMKPYKEPSLMDIGTGAGFPGIPIKLYNPEIILTLVEPRHKKAAFLHHLCGILDLRGVSVIDERFEELYGRPEHLRAYQIVVTRAFIKPNLALEAADPFLAPNGRIVLYLGPSTAERWVSGPGWSHETLDYRLPFSGKKRSIIEMVHAG
jgi:16S rRNA (guanine527-N7)-methyltransferase